QIFEGVVDVSTLMPKKPTMTVYNFDDYDLLDAGLRQFQRILRDTGEKSKTITPYTNGKWIGALDALGDTVGRERADYELARREFARFFPELDEFNIVSREQHKKFREAVMIESMERLREARNADGSPFVPQILSDRGHVLAGRQFCEFSEYHNNPSFRQF